MKTLLFFTYRGNLAATTDIANGSFINEPMAPSQLGCVVDTKNVAMTSEAKKIIKSAGRESGSFAVLMLISHANKKPWEGSVAVMGWHKHHFGTNVKIGRECDLEVLDHIEIDDGIQIPEDYIEYIDSQN